MKPTLLAPLLPPLLALSALASTGCQSSGQDINDHWNARSLSPRVAYHFLGYDPERDGDYRDFAWERKANINMTLRRHMFHHSPDNPNHEEMPSRFEPRPRNSLLPNPLTYIHLEGLLLGLASAGGSFVPVPIDSILGSFEKGGREEFMEGVRLTFGTVMGTPAVTFLHKWIEPEMGWVVTSVDELVR